MRLLLPAIALVACASAGPALSDVAVAPDTISPNGDGTADLARISYRLSTPAKVSIYLTDTDGQRHDVRRDAVRPASPQPYELLFNGIAGGRMLPNGSYTWTVQAVTEDGREMQQSGPLVIENADVSFPKINEFTASGDVFTPNRDAIDDHVYINVVTTKPSRLSVYVIGPNNFRYDVPRQEGLRTITDESELPAGRYFYDYDGGINLGADPPPDGLYQIVAESTDKIGQRDVLTKAADDQGKRPARGRDRDATEWPGLPVEQRRPDAGSDDENRRHAALHHHRSQCRQCAHPHCRPL